MRFSDFTRSVSGNTVTLRNFNPINSVGIINYYIDDSKGSVTKKEIRWSFDGDYWSSWEPLTQYNVSGISVLGNPMLFIEVRYEFLGTLSSSNNVYSFTLDYAGSSISASEVTIPIISSSDNITRSYPDFYVKPKLVSIYDASLLNSLSGSYYLNRANHTGQQSMDSIMDLVQTIQDIKFDIGTYDNIGYGDASVYFGRITGGIQAFRELGTNSQGVSISTVNNVILIDVSSSYFSTVSYVDGSINSLRYDSSLLRYDVNWLIVDVSTLYGRINVADSSINILNLQFNALDYNVTTQLDIMNASIGSITQAVNSLDSSIIYLLDYSSRIDSSLQHAISSIDSLDSCVFYLKSFADVLDSSLYDLTNRVDTIDTSLYLNTLYMNNLGTDVANLNLRVNTIDSSIIALALKTDSSIIYVLSLISKSDASINSLFNRVNTLDSSLHLLTLNVNVHESSIGSIILREDITDSSVSHLYASVNILDNSVHTLYQDVAFIDSSVKSLYDIVGSLDYSTGTRLDIIDQSVGYIIARLLVIDSSVSYMSNDISALDSSMTRAYDEIYSIDASIGRIDSSIYGILNHINVLDSSVNALYEMSVEVDSSINYIFNRLTVADTSISYLKLRNDVTDSSLNLLTSYTQGISTQVNFLLSNAQTVDASIQGVNNRLLIIDSSISYLDNNKVNRSGDTMTGSLTVLSGIRVTGDASMGRVDSSASFMDLNSGFTGLQSGVLTGMAMHTQSSTQAFMYDGSTSTFRIGSVNKVGNTYSKDITRKISTINDYVAYGSIIYYDGSTESMGGVSNFTFDHTDVRYAGNAVDNDYVLSTDTSTGGVVGITKIGSVAKMEPSSLVVTSPLYISAGDASVALISSLTLSMHAADASTSGYLGFSDFQDFSSRVSAVLPSDSCTGSLQYADIISYRSDNSVYLKRIIVDPGISLHSDSSTIRFSIVPTSFKSSFFADNSSYVNYPTIVHGLGTGPFTISVYEAGSQVYLDNRIDASGNVTINWVQGNLSGTCSIIIQA